MKPKLYIAGPMTGIACYNFAAFDDAAERWSQDWDVTTPPDITRRVWMAKHSRPFDPASDRCDYGDDTLSEMFALDLAAVCDADAIALLPGWENSKGAQLEIAVAKVLGKTFHDAVTYAELDIATVVRARVVATEAV